MSLTAPDALVKGVSHDIVPLWPPNTRTRTELSDRRQQPSVPRLDIGTKLVDDSAAGWFGKVYVEAGEAVWMFRGSAANPPPGKLEAEDHASDATDYDNVGRAERRSRTTIRRYCATTGIDRLWSLTYGPPFCRDPKQLRGDLASFIRRARYDVGGQQFPYVWVPELHGDSQRFHAHVGLAHFVKKRPGGAQTGQTIVTIY